MWSFLIAKSMFIWWATIGAWHPSDLVLLNRFVQTARTDPRFHAFTVSRFAYKQKNKEHWHALTIAVPSRAHPSMIDQMSNAMYMARFQFFIVWNCTADSAHCVRINFKLNLFNASASRPAIKRSGFFIKDMSPHKFHTNLHLELQRKQRWEKSGAVCGIKYLTWSKLSTQIQISSSKASLRRYREFSRKDQSKLQRTSNPATQRLDSIGWANGC